MVKKKSNTYICEECRLEYKEKEWADKCEAWCEKNKSCNIEITKHRIKENVSLIQMKGGRINDKRT